MAAYYVLQAISEDCIGFAFTNASPGMALWMEITGGVFTGAAFGGEMRSLYGDFSGPQSLGHVFMAIRPNLFMPIEEFKDRMDTMIER
ncbi:MAG: Ldh family oxidoreductase [Thermodesulfobacteriota bacterium]